MNPSPAVTRRRIAIALAVVALLSPLATGLAAAQSTQGTGGAVVVAEGETVDGLQTAAGTVVVRGTVAGDLSGAAGSIRIAETGRIDGDVSAAAGTITVEGRVGGDVEVGAGAFELTDTGRIDGSLDVGAGSVRVDGAVGGDVRATADDVVIGPNADVGGEFRYDAETFTRSPDATVAGGIAEDTSLGGDSGVGFGGDLVPSWVGGVYGVAVNLALGALLLLAFPRFSRGVADRVARGALRSTAVGLGVLVGVPVLLALVAITVVGIPLALVGIAAYVVALWVGSVYGRYALGSWVLDRLGSPNRWLALVVGVIGVALVGRIPWIGGLVDLVVLLFGVGALALGLAGRYRSGGDSALSGGDPGPIE
ncbi:bactofilin family protein [Halorubrum tebenquichense]|uniref:DUF8173 domain-containing protein n=1 Tax=Halorubrum tebenquichense DSM 14210 TaxID=1227485 RepID=M0D9B2_9EURY|nr:polymer-forming cytoskeletal protein [Halorubrum tebenquichense]ELZ32065.1 hypothetical protein C472_15969 [Halorubrum tebenquichense DSM 14210]